MTNRPDGTYYISRPDPQNQGEWLSIPRNLTVVRSEARARLTDETNAILAQARGAGVDTRAIEIVCGAISALIEAGNPAEGFAAAKQFVTNDMKADLTAASASLRRAFDIRAYARSLANGLAACVDVPAIEVWEKQSRLWP